MALSNESKEKKIKTILELLEKGATETSACRAVHTAPNTWKEWKRRSKELQEKAEIAQEKAILTAETTLYTLITDPNVKENVKMSAIAYFLKARAWDRWADRRGVEFSGEINIKLPKGIKAKDL